MSKDLQLFWGLTVIFGLSFGSQALALEGDYSNDRDVTVKESVDPSSGRETGEIGELEKESDRDLLSDAGHHESLHEDHESVNGESHESGRAESQDSGGGGKEPAEHLGSK